VVDHIRELGRQTVDRIGDELLERGQLTPVRTQIASECLAALDQGFESPRRSSATALAPRRRCNLEGSD
jgi:hypothetical protein